jgi:hypothetical protein
MGANRTFVLLSSKQHLKGTPSQNAFQDPILLPICEMQVTASVFVLGVNLLFFSF